MKSNQQFKFSPEVILFPLGFIMFLWLIFAIEIRFGLNFNSFGIFPQKLIGLRGIIFSPFIHGGIEHLYHNTIPLFILSSSS